MKILDLGCGNKKYESINPGDSVIGLDIIKKGTQADISHDLNKFPYPFDDSEFDLIICSHVLEHLKDILKVMNELHRISKNEGVIKISTPSWNGLDSYRDPTHNYHFTLDSFDYWDVRTPAGKFSSHYTGKGVQFKIIKKEIIFGRVYTMLGFNYFGNKFWGAYSSLFPFIPARELYFELRVSK